MTVAGQVGLRILTGASAILVEARSSVGPITFGSTSLAGTFTGEAGDDDGAAVRLVEARAVVPVTSLTSGNRLYDNELHQRLDARRFPEIVASLRDVRELGNGRFDLAGDLTIHGETREQGCTADVVVGSTDAGRASVVVSGSAALDIRDFDISLPSALMLRIYPDVTVRFRVEAAVEVDHDGQG